MNVPKISRKINSSGDGRKILVSVFLNSPTTYQRQRSVKESDGYPCNGSKVNRFLVDNSRVSDRGIVPYVPGRISTGLI